MNDLNPIITALERLFHEEGQRIVFWNDPEGSSRTRCRLLISTACKSCGWMKSGRWRQRFAWNGRNRPSKFLLYSPAEEPDYENDWLLDIASIAAVSG